MRMRTGRTVAAAAAAAVGLVVAAAALLSPAATGGDDLDDEVAVRALVAVRAALHDPGHVLRDWDPKSGGGDPCSWRMVTCNSGQVYELSLRHQNLSGTLSPAIGELASLQYLSLYGNAISGPIPGTIGMMQLLQSIDLSNNQFSGSIPSTLGGLMNLQFLKLNNNSLSGPIPESLATAPMIVSLDLSFNNLSGSWPMFRARIVFLDGNPLLTGSNCTGGSNSTGVENPLYGGGCSPVVPSSLDLPAVKKPTNLEDDLDIIDERVRIFSLLALCIAIACSVITLAAGAAMLLWHRRRSQQVVAVDANNIDVSSAISISDSELVDGKPALDWPRRKRIALGVAQGLLYLHDQCDPKIIHRDIQASNTLLYDYLEATIPDFGLAKLKDQEVSHVFHNSAWNTWGAYHQSLMTGQA